MRYFKIIYNGTTYFESMIDTGTVSIAYLKKSLGIEQAKIEEITEQEYLQQFGSA